ncbi:MAG: amidohydrolase [Candidatus Micrarchaeia archaeon]
MSLLLRNATIVTQDSSRAIVRGDILVRGNIIEAAGGTIGEEADTVIDASGMIAMPGLVNCHTHVGMTILRGYGEDLPLHKWLEERIWPVEARQTASDAGVAASLAFCEMIRGGTTAFADMCLHDTKPVFDAAGAAGMRGLIARGLMDFNSDDFRPRVVKEIERSLAYGDQRVRPSAAAHAPYTCSQELIARAKELSRERGLRFQIHAAETRKEVFEVQKKHGKFPYEYLDSLGVMDSGSIFAHGGWLTKKEIGLAGRRSLNIASCPLSNLKLATGGIAQITELDAAGANVTLGTDGAASNNSLDMFETMKMAALLQKHHYWKADAIPTGKILDFATINGAKALGIDAGSIAPGKLADIVLLERGPNMCPEHDLVANLVYSAGPQNVRTVIIDGKIVMMDREILTVDESSVMEKAGAAVRDILGR